jgi:hypothetical protein
VSRTKAQRYYDSIKADRYEWRDSLPNKCMWCGRDFLRRGEFRWPEIHEILSRAQAPNRWWFRANGLVLCNDPCHERAAASSHAMQLSVKKRRDPAHYDLQLWLATRNPAAMQYVTEAEIEELIRKAA